MFRNLLLLLLILFAGYTYFWLDRTEQLGSFVSAVKKDFGIAGDLVDEIAPLVEEKFAVRDGWTKHEDVEFRFEIQHPETWDIEIDTVSSSSDALQRIVIRERVFDEYQGRFSLSVLLNSDDLSVNDWWESYLALDDTAKELCQESSDQASSCILLRDRATVQEYVDLPDTEKIIVRVVHDDTVEACHYLSGHTYVYGLCFDVENAEDTNLEAHTDVYFSILNTFSITGQEPKTSLALMSELLSGLWVQNGENAGSWNVSIEEERITEETGEGEERLGQFMLSEEENDIRIVVQYEGEEEQVFQIDSIDESNLVLLYLADDSTLRFTREVSPE